jgi:sec-independent protein translocase protein TatA
MQRDREEIDMGGWDAPWHWIVLAIVVIALFGYKKLPDAARSLGRSLRIFKTEIKGMSEDDKRRESESEPKQVEAGTYPAATVQPVQSAPPAQPVSPSETVQPPVNVNAPAPSAPAANPSDRPGAE